MNNDLEQFSEERLKNICEFTKGGVDVLHVEIEALARIALSVKQAKPVAYLYHYLTSGGQQQHLSVTEMDISQESIIKNKVEMNPLYTTPHPAHTELDLNPPEIPDGWKLVPIEMTDDIGEEIAKQARCCGGIALDIYDAALAAAPKPESE